MVATQAYAIPYSYTIVWVNNFPTPEIQAVLSSFFHDGNDIAGGSNRVVGGLNIGVQNGIPEVQFGALLYLSCAQIKDNRHCPALRGLSSPPSTNTSEP